MENTDMSINFLSKLAKICHEAARAHEENETEIKRNPWEDSSGDHRRGLIETVGFIKQNPDATPEQVHEQWVKRKKKAGWRRGEKRSEKDKTSPYLVRWDELPDEIKMKTTLFIAITRSFS